MVDISAAGAAYVQKRNLESKLDLLKQQGKEKGYTKSMAKRQNEMMKELQESRKTYNLATKSESEMASAQNKILTENQRLRVKNEEEIAERKRKQKEEERNSWGGWIKHHAGATAGAVIGTGLGILLAPATGGASIVIGMGLGAGIGSGVDKLGGVFSEWSDMMSSIFLGDPNNVGGQATEEAERNIKREQVVEESTAAELSRRAELQESELELSEDMRKEEDIIQKDEMAGELTGEDRIDELLDVMNDRKKKNRRRIPFGKD